MIMAKKSGEGNVHNNVKEVLDMLRIDGDSDEEDFEESQPKLQEESERENNEELENLTLKCLLFLQMKIYKDQVCNNNVKYLAEMVQYGTKNLPVQQEVREKEILPVRNQALSDLYWLV